MNKSESKYFNTARKMDEAFLQLLNKKDFEFITVKEICIIAGVNRSTFYLHYETINDLLVECIEYINKKFATYFANHNCFDKDNFDDLFFIKPEYLKPYLTFIKENKKLFQTVVKRYEILGQENNFNKLFDNLFIPILEKYNVPQENRKYIILFYIEGIYAIIKEWIREGLVKDIDKIVDIIVNLIKNPNV